MRLFTVFASCGALALILWVSVAHAVTVPTGFVVEQAYPGCAFNRPTSFCFVPDGRVLVAEKRGVVRVIENGTKLPEPMWDAQIEVLNKGDRGLLGIAVDPDYLMNRWVYLIYSVDPDSNGSDFHEQAFGRITRYQTSLANPNVFDLSTRQVLIGRDWSDGFPSGSQTHAIGALQWGTDGSLLASCGDGAHYRFADVGGHDDEMFGPGRLDPSEDIGAFRSQSLNSLAGKILRINPETGYGYTSNPYFDGDVRSVRSRVWAYGFRNPYRFSVQPGTGSTDTSRADPGVIATVDVGWRDWEEVNLVTAPGQNFGWPCFEGPDPRMQYQSYVSNPINCESISSPGHPGWPRSTTIAWHHGNGSRSTPKGLVGSCAGGGTFYPGGDYPEWYDGLYFFSDFVYNWISIAAFDDNHNLAGVTSFSEQAEGAVDFVPHPETGDIHFMAYRTGLFYRIRYAPPLAVGTARPALALSSPYPNPTAGKIAMTLELPSASDVAFSIHDAAGRLVWRAPRQVAAAGRTALEWNGIGHDGARVRPGLYFARVRVNDVSAVRRLVVLR